MQHRSLRDTQRVGLGKSSTKVPTTPGCSSLDVGKALHTLHTPRAAPQELLCQNTSHEPGL